MQWWRWLWAVYDAVNNWWSVWACYRQKCAGRPVVLKVGSTLLEELHGTDASVNIKWWRWAWLTGRPVYCVCFMSGHDSLHVASSSSSSSLVKKEDSMT